jgi:hypothetical protein
MRSSHATWPSTLNPPTTPKANGEDSNQTSPFYRASIARCSISQGQAGWRRYCTVPDRSCAPRSADARVGTKEWALQVEQKNGRKCKGGREIGLTVPGSYNHSVHRTVRARPIAISCLGAFWTPADRARGCHCIHRHPKTCTGAEFVVLWRDHRAQEIVERSRAWISRCLRLPGESFTRKHRRHRYLQPRFPISRDWFARVASQVTAALGHTCAKKFPTQQLAHRLFS